MTRPSARTLPVITSMENHGIAAVACIGLFAATILLTGCPPPRSAKPAPPVEKPALQVNKIEQLLACAENFEKQGHYFEAREKCQSALRIDPRDPHALECKTRLDQTLLRLANEKVRNGIAMAKKGKTAAANQMFLKALQLWPMHEQALRQIGRNHLLKQTPFILHKLKSGDNLTSLALKYYGSSFYYPIIAEFNQVKQDSKVKAGERLRIPKIAGLPLRTHGAAIKTMTPVELKVVAYRQQGMKYIKAGKFKRAIARLQKALRIDNDDLATRQKLAAAYHGLAEQLFVQKEYARARDHFLNGLKFDSNCTPCQEGLDRCHRIIADKHTAEAQRLFEDHQYEEAVAEMEKARKLVPGDEQIDDIISLAYHNKARELCAGDDFEAAREYFELAAKFNPERPNDHDYERLCRDAYVEIHYNRGNTYYKNGRVQAAISEWTKASDLNPHYKAVRYNLSLARMMMRSDRQ